jgi:hypothetical protein
MGFSFGFDVLTARLRARRTTFSFPENGLEELPTHHGGFRCHTEPWLQAPSLKERLVCWTDGGVILGCVVRFSVDHTA